MPPSSVAFVFIVLAISVLLGGCASTLDREFVPQQLVATAEIDGLPGIRGWGDEPPSLQRLKAAVARPTRVAGRWKSAWRQRC